MAGAEPLNIPVEIESEETNIVNYNFSLLNGDKLIALWTDGIALDKDLGVEAKIILPDFPSSDVEGIDVLEGNKQPLTVNEENNNLIIKVVVRDYPIILYIK